MITKTTTENKGNGYDTNLLFRMNLLRLKSNVQIFHLFEFSINSYYIVTLPASIFTYFANDNTFAR